MMNPATEQPNGLAAAALLAAGIGSFFLGFMTSLSEGIHSVETALNWYNPTGALTGKTIIAILAWWVSWAILAAIWKNRTIGIGKVLTATYILIALGLLGTFPLFFDLL
jgi:peptidoglycan biosynthesis protein MviN/MurJ (putative lipid II flippase)